VALDARGHGESGWDGEGDYSLDALAADLRSVIADLAVEPVLVGASLGGLTSLIASGEGWVEPRALVLVDVVPRIEVAGAERIRAFMTGRPDGYGSLEDVAEDISRFNPHRRRSLALSGLRRNVRRHENGRWHWHWDPRFLPPVDDTYGIERHRRTLQAAREIAVPALLLRAEHSEIVSDEGVAELRAAMPHARYESVPGVGHMIAGDDNDVFVARLAEFFSDAGL
jgi:pimeloyl-ACP methyl ester carboxylesterase